MNTIYIDTRDNKRIVIRLDHNGKAYTRESEANIQKAQATLPLIDELLKETNLKPQDIEEIKIERGPGSFTGLRVGMAIANAISLALSIKINEHDLGDIETPEY